MTRSIAAGYSGTPLAKKLGIRQGSQVLLVGAPDDYESLLAPLPPGVVFQAQAGEGIDLVQVFVTRRAELEKHLASLRRKLRAGARNRSRTWSTTTCSVRPDPAFCRSAIMLVACAKISAGPHPCGRHEGRL